MKTSRTSQEPVARGSTGNLDQSMANEDSAEYLRPTNLYADSFNKKRFNKEKRKEFHHSHERPEISTEGET